MAVHHRRLPAERAELVVEGPERRIADTQALQAGEVVQVDECGEVPELQVAGHHRRLPGRAFLALSVAQRSDEHTSELQSLMRISYAVFCLKNIRHTYTSLI